MLNHRLPNRFKCHFEAFRKLSWRERLKIALGFNLKIAVDVAVDKRDGRVWQNLVCTLTKEVNADGQVKTDMEKQA